MKKLVTAALLGTVVTLAACGGSYEEGEATEAYTEEDAGATYAPPADETPAPEPTGPDTPEPEPTDTTAPEPEPAEPDAY